MKTDTTPQQNKKDVFYNKSVALTVEMIGLARVLRKDPSLWPVLDQVLRSAGSIGANVREAHGATTKKDFAHFFSISLKSANETVYWLEVLQAAERAQKDRIELLLSHVLELRTILKASLRTMRLQ